MQSIIISIKEKLSTTDFFRKRSQNLIELYKARHFSKLNNINNQLFPGKIQIDPSADNKKLFYSLIKIFHPDSYKSHLKRFNEAISNDDTTTIDFYSRLISIELDNGKNNLVESEYNSEEVYIFDKEEDESYVFNDVELNESEIDQSIISIISEMFLGNSGRYLESIDLSQIDGELILSDSNISNLDGLQYCIGVTNLDLSHNKIENIYEINSLERLEELDLSNNDIVNIDQLIGLDNLETLYLDSNQIDDIEILLKLKELKFVSILDNPLKNMDVLHKLQENGVIVIYY